MHAAVVGLGAMGGAVAYHLAKRGIRVTGFDLGRPPHGAGSSHGESRIIREAYFEHPLYVPLVRRARELWRELEVESGSALLRTSGVLMVGPAGGSLLEGSARSARLHDIPHVRMLAGEARKRFPWLRIPDGSEALLEPDAGVLQPETCVEAHLDRARALGADLRLESRVTSWETGADHLRLRLPSGLVEVDAIVFCAGSWLPALFPSLPLEVERQVMSWFPLRPDDPGGYPPDGPAFLWETENGELYYGIAGPHDEIKVARHHGGVVGARGTLDTIVRPADIGVVRTFLDRHIPGVTGEPLRGSVCRYTNTPTGRFLIAPAPGDSRIHLVSACSGHGFKFASAIGEAVARRLSGQPDLIDLTPFGIQAALAPPRPQP